MKHKRNKQVGNGVAQFAGRIVLYKKLLVEAKQFERAAKKYEHRMSDDGEFVYLAFLRAARARQAAADRIIDDAAESL